MRFLSIREIECLYDRTPKNTNTHVSYCREKLFEASLKNRLTKHEKESEFLTKMNRNLKSAFGETFSHMGERFKVYHRAGRQHNYDFEMRCFSTKSDEAYTPIKLEYKTVQSCSKMDIFEYPQLMSVSTESERFGELFPDCHTSYLTHVYTYYLDEVCELVGADKPSEDAYLAWAKSTSKNKDHTEKLFASIRYAYKTHQRAFRELARESLIEYVESVSIDLDQLLRTFVELNRDKYIVFQCREHFEIQNCNRAFDLDTLRFTGYEKNRESIVVDTNAPFGIEIRFRWKNGQIRQNPAFDIVLFRKKK